MKLKMLIVTGNGVEDTELVLTRDILLRNGIDVDLLALSETEFLVTSYNLKIKKEINYSEVIKNLSEYCGIFLPGGPGTLKLSKNQQLHSLLKSFSEQKKIIAAICLAPLILAEQNLLVNKKMIVYPDKNAQQSCEKHGALIVDKHCQIGDEHCQVVVDGNIITGLRMEVTLPFAKILVKELQKKS